MLRIEDQVVDSSTSWMKYMILITLNASHSASSHSGSPHVFTVVHAARRQIVRNRAESTSTISSVEDVPANLPQSQQQRRNSGENGSHDSSVRSDGIDNQVFD